MNRTPEGNANRSTAQKRRLDPLVQQMYADYQAGLSLSQVAEKYGRGGRHAAQNVQHLFAARGLPRRPRPRPEDYARIAATRRARLDAQAPAMWEAYQRLKSCAAVAKLFNSDKGTVKYVLQRNGYEVREIKEVPRQANGSPARLQPKSDAEIRALVQQATRFVLPDELRFEWRRWPLDRRAWFVGLLRTRFPSTRPSGACSRGVRLWSYGDPEAHRIVDRMNAGLPSRQHKGDLRIASEGVICDGRLWFWVQEGQTDGVGSYRIGPYDPVHGRPALHRVLWERYHGRPVPRGHVVRHADGNRNNFAKTNLILATQNDIARENQAAALTRKSRARVELLLRRAHGETPDANRHLVQDLVNS